MPEQEQDFIKALDEVLNNLKDSSPQSKEYCKFLIGLSTGTLMFSVTFLKQLAPFPQYKFLLAIGWLCLLASIVAGVLLLPKPDQLQTTIQNLKFVFGSPQIAAAFYQEEFHQFCLKEWIKRSIRTVKADEKMKEELIQKVDDFATKDLEKFSEVLTSSEVKDSEREYFKEVLKFLSLSKKIQNVANPTALIRKYRKIILQTIWFNIVLIYGFFVGVFAISLFSIINFLK